MIISSVLIMYLLHSSPSCFELTLTLHALFESCMGLLYELQPERMLPQILVLNK